jgi:hypothetical protein
VLKSDKKRELATWLGDSPTTVLAVHALNRDACWAGIVGYFPKIRAALIQSNELPSEPQAFGSDVKAIWTLLQAIQGWDCVNVASAVAASLGVIIQNQLKRSVRYYDDFYYTLSISVQRFEHEFVRRLTARDLTLLEAAPKPFQGHGYGTPRRLLDEGLVACGITSGEIVSIAHTAGHTTKYADIGVITTEEWRNQGLASAAASIVAEGLQELGITPVWSKGDDNLPSVRIAEKLGFNKVSQRQYVILE